MLLGDAVDHIIAPLTLGLRLFFGELRFVIDLCIVKFPQLRLVRGLFPQRLLVFSVLIDLIEKGKLVPHCHVLFARFQEGVPFL